MFSLPFEKPSELLRPEKALRQKHTGAVGMYENGPVDFGGRDADTTWYRTCQ